MKKLWTNYHFIYHDLGASTNVSTLMYFNHFLDSKRGARGKSGRNFVVVSYLYVYTSSVSDTINYLSFVFYLLHEFALIHSGHESNSSHVVTAPSCNARKLRNYAGCSSDCSRASIYESPYFSVQYRQDLLASHSPCEAQIPPAPTYSKFVCAHRIYFWNQTKVGRQRPQPATYPVSSGECFCKVSAFIMFVLQIGMRYLPKWKRQ